MLFMKISIRSTFVLLDVVPYVIKARYASPEWPRKAGERVKESVVDDSVNDSTRKVQYAEEHDVLEAKKRHSILSRTVIWLYGAMSADAVS